MTGRWITIVVFALVAAGAFVFFSTGADSTADEIIGAAEANEALAESAPAAASRRIMGDSRLR
jgi:hypothetical protein